MLYIKDDTAETSILLYSLFKSILYPEKLVSWSENTTICRPLSIYFCFYCIFSNHLGLFTTPPLTNRIEDYLEEKQHYKIFGSQPVCFPGLENQSVAYFHNNIGLQQKPKSSPIQILNWTLYLLMINIPFALSTAITISHC